MKGALIADPVFDSASKVAAVSPRLVMEDRFAIRHKGYIGGGDRALGVNDIVALLYPGVAAQYRRLHMASVHVRYLTGLGAVTAASVRSDYKVVAAAYRGGALVHG
ncbi:hypothetical protein [Rathayibacter sp. VKM Ac-2857]|uniref:hypothetical protein n=1 Tax=Rathayibacter sp. VKM Ac-2857 TaxID=2739020 RepID=UPI0015676E1F|nr:hypothetical protein [Rathayibacter sp. VKM Ac-2857]NQX15121.1 hypothetical protein [Rathayibacter sp. VKM Ac-2857]